jgi:glutathione S-transferase
VDSFLDWLHTTFRPAVAGYGFVHTIAPISFGKKFDQKQIESARTKAIKTIGDFESYWLKDGPFIGGMSKPSIADIFAFGELVQLLVLLEESKFSEWKLLDEHQKLRTWAQQMESLKHYEQVHKGLQKFRELLAMKKAKL